MNGPIVIVGETLLDIDVDGTVERICPDAPAPVLAEVERRVRPGGAALAALLVRRATDAPVILLSTVGDDPAGEQVRALLRDGGVDLIDLTGSTTTPQKIRMRAEHHTLVRLDRGDGPAAIDPQLPEPAAEALSGSDAVLVADYGLGLLGRPELRQALQQSNAPIVWDPHPRSGPPIPGITVLTPNEAELDGFIARHGTDDTASDDPARGPLGRTADAARRLCRHWQAKSAVVTRGADGVLLVRGDDAPVAVPAARRSDGDTCGAGDAFAAALTVDLAEGRLLVDALETAVRAAADHVERNDRTWRHHRETPGPETPAPAERPDRPVSDRRQRLVATGGCFDLLHAGHVATLRAARALGDRLVVLLNSDQSVRRLKGPDRPLQNEDDRRALLLALDCVDDVVVFDEDTPVAVLEELRPDLFVKGGDYAGLAIAERDVLARWGGEVVTVPYLRGRSTTRLLEEARRDL